MPDPRNRLIWNATCKVYPAIADLQAIEVQIDYDGATLAGDTGTITLDSGAVPAGKLWILNHAAMWCDTNALTQAVISLKATASDMAIMSSVAPAVKIPTLFTGSIIMKPTEYVRFIFYGVVAVDDELIATMRAYQVSQY